MTTVSGRRLGDHLFWPFHGVDDFVPSAREYVSDGLEHRERVMFVRVGRTGMQHADIATTGDVVHPPGSDVPVLRALTDEPGWTPSSSALVPLRRMTQAAVDDGYAGLRVLTDATDVAQDPVTRQQWVRSEHLMDRYGLDHPVAILCGYDLERVGPEVAGEVACVHALTGGVPSPFLLRAIDELGGLGLSGQVDRASATALYRAVLTTAADLTGPVVIDLSEQEFLDHSGLSALDRAAQELGTTVQLVGASALTATLVDCFGLTGVTVREAA
jgi:anti-anti-sigma regulatory factor